MGTDFIEMLWQLKLILKRISMWTLFEVVKVCPVLNVHQAPGLLLLKPVQFKLDWSHFVYLRPRPGLNGRLF